MHWKDARAAARREDRLYSLDAWRESPLYSDRERAALELCEAITLIADSHVPDDVWDAAAAEFEPRELAHLVFAITAINAWNRLVISARTRAGELPAMRPVTVSITVPNEPRGGLRLPRRAGQPRALHRPHDGRLALLRPGPRARRARPHAPQEARAARTGWTSRSSRSTRPRRASRRPSAPAGAGARAAPTSSRRRRRAGRGSRSASSGSARRSSSAWRPPLTRSVLRRGNQRSLERLAQRLTLVPQP